MSVLLAMNTGRFVMFASDCCETFYNPELTEIRAQRMRPKMAQTPMGIVLGTGWISLLRGVSRRIGDEVPDTIGGLLAIIRTERQGIELDATMPATKKQHALLMTGWALSYLGAGADGAREARLAVYHPGLGDDFLGLPAGYGIPFIPSVSASDETERDGYHELVQARLEAGLAAVAGDSIDEDVCVVAHVLRGLIAEMAAGIETVSEECQIGIHAEDGRVFVSDMLLPRDVLAWPRAEAGETERPADVTVAA